MSHGIDQSGDAPVALRCYTTYARVAMDAVQKIKWIADQLLGAYKHQAIQLQDPVENLVLTILSQNTTDINRDRAFHSLIASFASLDNVVAASVDDIAASIQSGGLQQQKARSIREALSRIVAKQGKLDLGFLGDLALEEALRWLLALPGVGPKTASIVLLFSFNRPVFPVDTHIRRVMSRMGLVQEQGDPHEALNALLPADHRLMQQLHLLTIRLGREVCHPRKPSCEQCPLLAMCMWSQAHGLPMTDRVTSPHKREASKQ